MSKHDFLLTWPWVWMLLWMNLFFNLSLIVIQGHWLTLHSRGHRLLRVGLSEISGLGPKWSLATDTQRILKIRRRISLRWRFWSVAWLNLIKDFLDILDILDTLSVIFFVSANKCVCCCCCCWCSEHEKYMFLVVKKISSNAMYLFLSYWWKI